MKIKFKIDVTPPAAQVGTKGEIKEVDDRAAKILIKGGYAERADIVARKVAKKVARKGGKARLSAAYAERDLKAIAKKKVVKKKVAVKKKSAKKKKK